MSSELTKFTEIKKNNAAIHIDTTHLTLTHRKAFNILIWNAWDELEKNKVHTIEMWELMRMLDYHDIHKLKVELEKLPTIGVTWNLFREDEWPIDSGACALVAGFRMVGNVFRYSFFEDFRPLLKNPKIWTKIKIEVANLFKSSYALALYENCFRFADVGSTGWKDVEEWREMIGVPNSQLYKRFSEVNHRIFKPAIKEVNKLSDITIAPEYKKKGRGGAIRQIKFTIEKKPNFKIHKQLDLPFTEEDKAKQKDINKQFVQSQVAAFAPKSKAAEELQQQNEKPGYIYFSQEPSEQVKNELKAQGFEYWAQYYCWVNEATNPAKIFKLKMQVGADQADLGYPNSNME